MSKKTAETNAAQADVEKEKNTGLAEINNSGGELVSAPAFMGEEDFHGNGFEGVDKDSFAIPFLQVLQKSSPLVDEDHPKYVPGAKAGMLFNTVTSKLYDGRAGVTVIPCAYKRVFIQWGSRDGDGGFKGEFTPEQFAAMVENKDVTMLNGKAFIPDKDGLVNEKKSDYIADTRSHYVLLKDPDTGDYSMAVISLSSTLTKASRTLMTLLQQKKVNTPGGKKTPPTFANLVTFKTIPMTNDKGSWSGAKFELDGMVQDKQTFEDAKDFYRNIHTGKIKADHSRVVDAADDDAGVGEGAATADNF